MSTQANTGRPWTVEEDNLLKEAVYIYGENTEKWKIIATHVPGRTNKACRKRWLHSLSPFVKKTAWTAEEDRLLLSLFERHPFKWAIIARAIPGRTDDACSKRYLESLDPKLKKDEWTEEEDRKLLEFLEHGGPSKPRWRQIGQELNRSGLGCRNRWRLLERKRLASARSLAAQRQETGDVVSVPSFDGTSLYVNGTTANYAFEHGMSVQVHHATDDGVHQGNNSTFNFISSLLPATAILHQTLAPGQDNPFPHTQVATSFDFPVDSYDFFPENETFEQQNPVAPLDDAGPPDVSTTTEPTIPESNDNTNVTNTYDSHEPTASSSTELAEHWVAVEGEHVTEQQATVSTRAPSIDIEHPVPPDKEHEEESTGRRLPSLKRRRLAEGVKVLRLTDSTKKESVRLSSTLVVANDPSILAYACGNSRCWPAGSEASSSRFPTSGELFNHYKDSHIQDPVANDDLPFRCGLESCGKGWKSINGLQYHLQISTAHYRKALSTTATTTTSTSTKKRRKTQSSDPTPDADNVQSSTSPLLTTGSDGVGATPDVTPTVQKTPKKRKLHPCPHEGCLNEYKQLSGLRYHLLHGHAGRPPVQLEVIPPAIARRLENDS